VEFYLNLNITQHNLYWKLSTTHQFNPTFLTQSSIGQGLQTQQFSVLLISKVKLRPTKQTSPEESFQHLNILCLPKFYTLSVSKFMHSYYNRQLPNHFDDYFIPLSSIHSYPTRLSTSNNMLLLRANSSSGKCFHRFVGPEVWSAIPDY